MALRFTKLDRASIRSLAAGQKITEHGITAERMANGDVRYSVNIMVDGQRIHRVIGRESDGTTRTQCEEFIAAKRTEAREDRLSLPKARKLHLTFVRAADIYLARQKEVGAKNLVKKEQHIRLHLVPFFGNMRLDKITGFTLQKFERHCLNGGLTVATKNRIAATYNHAVRRLSEWPETKPKAPLPIMKVDPENNERDFVLSAEEDAELLEAALVDPNSYLWLFVKVGLATSMRHREILSARFDNLDPVRRRLRVQVKGGRWRKQPLTREIITILEKEREMADDPDGWVFPSRRTKSGHTEDMGDAFARIVKVAEMDPEEVTPHTLRHTAITRFSGTNPDIKTLQAFSGHKSIQALMRYLHEQDRRVDDAMDHMEQSSVKRAKKSGTPAQIHGLSKH